MTEPEDFSTVLRVVRGELPQELLLAWTDATWIEVLQDLPRDGFDFLGRFEVEWSEAIGLLRPWRESATDDRLAGFTGLLLLTLVSLQHSERHRQAADKEHDCSSICEPLLGEATVREAIRKAYQPDSSAGQQGVIDWNGIDFDSLRFHRHGTTSFILRGLPVHVAHGRRQPLALKCIIQPYLRVPVIVRATRDYFRNYALADSDASHLVRVWASGSSWILMDFVEGRTLGEYLESLGPSGGRLRLDLLDDLGGKLFTAMAELEQSGFSHGDLSPSNIVVHAEADVRRFVLIDLGTNYLYTDALPGTAGADVFYVAPEVRGGQKSNSRTDLYSVGQLLMVIAGVKPVNGTVPDSLYARTTVLARFVEDFVDSNPDHRLLIYGSDPAEPTYPRLAQIFAQEVEALKAASTEEAPSWWPEWAKRVVGMFRPLAGAPGRQRRLMMVRIRQSLSRDSRRGMHAVWLVAWSWASAVAWGAGALIVGSWWLRDAQVEWELGNQAIDLLLPFLDQYRRPDYPIPDLMGNLPVRLVAISFLLATARVYQNIVSGFTPLVTGTRQGGLSVLAYMSEILMRFAAVVAFIVFMPATLIDRDWWPFALATGICVLFVTNATLLAFAHTALKRAAAHGLSVAPDNWPATLESYRTWTPSSAFYAPVCVCLAWLITAGIVKDVYVYAVSAAAINIVMFYMIKCSGPSAAAVRVGLGRACLAAERMRYLNERPRGSSA